MCCPKCTRFSECSTEWETIFNVSRDTARKALERDVCCAHCSGYFECDSGFHHNWSASDYVASVKNPEIEIVPRQ